MAPAAAAGAEVAKTEDALIHDALLTADGAQQLSLSDWTESGKALDDVVSASQALAEAGVFAPRALVVGPKRYALLRRPFRNSGRQEHDLVSSVADGGVHQSPALGDDKALLVPVGVQFLDLAVGQDMATAYLGPEGMDHRFRVIESLVLRIKQPGSICILS
jgi:uncharacterized linocin/CFP29 family protein